MSKLAGVLVGLFVPAFFVAGVVATPAMAQGKAAKGAPTVKVLLENDKVKVYENTYKPGDVNTGVPSSATRIIRVMKGGTIERSYADGKKETLVLKTGEVNFYTRLPAYNVKNIGKTVLQTYVVQLK